MDNKEMTIEEKAKAYDEALEKARCYYEGANGNEDMITMTTTMFPVLKESEVELVDDGDLPKEEPANDELEKVVEEIVDPTVLNAYGVKEIANRLRRTMIESVSEDLNTVAIEYANNITEKIGYRLQLRRAVCFGAKWKKERLMAKAVDATVHIDAGGYPYIPQIELYDYDKDIPLAKVDDKYKVVLIKEG